MSATNVNVTKKLFRDVDAVTLVCTLLLISIGLLTVFSAAHKSGLGEIRPFFWRQLTWAILGLIAMFVAIVVDYRYITVFAYSIYGAVLALMVVLLFVGREVHGAQRWIRFLGVGIQPSEILKVATLFALAHYFDVVRDRIRRLPYLMGAILMAMVPTMLIVIQPDLGTGLVIVAMLGAMVFAAGAQRRHILALGGMGVLAFPVLWHFLKDYQKARLLSFVNPNLDPLGASYQVIQSKIAVGAGGFVGRGWLAGTQSRLNFLPEQHTDFIFSVFAEQWGFLGACLLIILYVGLLFQAIKIAQSARDYIGSILAVGIITILYFQILVNLLMTVGLMPVTGIPLPFMSYGGSDLLTMSACVGVLLSIGKRAHIFQ